MKNVLITGATGFAGKYLINHLKANSDYSITGTSFSGVPDAEENVVFTRVDLGEEAEVNKLVDSNKFDFVYHLAALTSPAESLTNPAKTITNNIVAQVNLLEAIKNSASKDAAVLIVSSADVYGKVAQKFIPINEDAPLMPTNPYAVSKISQDFLGLQYHLSHDMNIIRVRPFNHFGPGQESKFVIPSFAKQIAEIEKGQKEAVIKVGNLIAKKDFSDVRDIVKAYSEILERGHVGEVYNIGSGRSIEISDILKRLLALSSVEIAVEEDKSLFRQADSVDFVCDTTKVHDEIGWSTKIPFDVSLKDTLDYWRKVI